MTTLKQALDNKGHAILEMPTGTGLKKLIKLKEKL
jgi:hypothetical protein